MTASQQCKQAGFKSLTELADITWRSIRTELIQPIGGFERVVKRGM